MPQETFNNKLYVLLVILSIAVIVIAAGLYSSIAGSAGAKLSQEQKGISVTGSASGSVLTDTASISLGVLTQAPTAKEALEKNAVSMNAVIGALKNLGLQDKDIRTSILSIQPVYNPREGGVPAIVGYSASNNVQVTTRMLDKLGDIVDKSVASGANQVSGISFEVSEEKQKQIRDELIEKAVNDSSARADKLAESLKVRIIGVRASSISESGFPQPIPLAPGIAEKAVTPILPGESRVTLSVQVTYIIE